MSHKRILNMTSIKKRDNMRTAAFFIYNGTVNFGTGYQIPPQPPTSGSPAVSADVTNTQTFLFPWTCTSRNSLTQQRFNLADRTNSTCYMKGLKEMVRLQTTGPDEWDWRRIGFTFKGPAIASIQQSFYQDGAATYRYLYSPSNETSTTNQRLIQQTIYSYIFDGTFQQDWSDPMTAKTDKTRVTIKYDKRFRIRSGNQQAITRYINCWHPMNKNLYYDDDEFGSGTQQSQYSVDSKKGMGDYYIVDLFRCSNPSGITSLLYFPQSTLYWHER